MPKAPPAGPPLLFLDSICKRFPGMLANDQVTLGVWPGEIHALVGENGAGKSTLVNIACGLHQPDAGHIYLRGRRVVFRTPADARDNGIGVVHQRFMLVPTLTVLENLLLGRAGAGVLHAGDASRQLQSLTDQYGLAVDPAAYVWQLAAGLQQRVEILKALDKHVQVLLLDEPTSVLTPIEVDDLFRLLRSLAAAGLAITFISHKLEEVLRIADRVTVLRNGRVVGTVMAVDATAASLAALMVDSLPEAIDSHSEPEGVSAVSESSNSQSGTLVLEVENLVVPGDRGIDAVRGISFTLCRGEVLSLVGVDGNGQRELEECIAGLREASSGQLRFRTQTGQWVPAKRLAGRKDFRFGYIPENRDVMGLATGMTVMENLFLRSYRGPPFSRRGLLSRNAATKQAQALLQHFDVRSPGLDAPAAVLSGGNRQKLILARELASDLTLLLAAHPTRGLDIAATAYVRDCLLQQRHHGAAVLVISADLDEALSLGDRIAVMFSGQLMGIGRRGSFSRASIGLMMGGLTRQGPEARPLPS